jgi:hypothetical protein
MAKSEMIFDYVTVSSKDDIEGKVMAASLDHVIESLAKLVEHQKTITTGPRSAQTMTDIFTSYVVSLVGSMLVEIDHESAVYMAQMLSSALIEYTRHAQRVMKEEREQGTSHG